MKVLKFGGSSIENAQRIKEVKRIIQSRNENFIVVVSALHGITDKLIDICHMASTRNETYQTELTKLEKLHTDIVNQVITDPTAKTAVLSYIRILIAELTDLLHGVYLLHDITPRIQDYVLSFGERMSAYIIAHVVDNAVYMDSREFIRTDENFGKAQVDMAITQEQIVNTLKGASKTVVLPGFIGATHDNSTTTLGRGGADYTAAIIAAALNAELLEIWTDVDGFMTADPKKVAKAVPIANMSYAEAIELSHFGARVVYTPTIQPVYQKNIPICIKNSFNPLAAGTLISKQTESSCESPVKGISSIDEIVLITLQGTGMIGVPGTSMRLFGALAHAKVNIILITQASSEFSITFAITPADLQSSVKALEDEFRQEIFKRNELNILVENDLSIIAVVGEGMKNTPGISANLFRSLARNGISVIAVAQGSSELNISIAIHKKYLSKALNSIHEGFFLSQQKELNLFLVGTGIVGGALLEQLHKQQEVLLKEKQVKLNVAGIINAFFMAFDENGLPLDDYNSMLEKKGAKADLNTYVNTMLSMNLRNSVFIDCTASAEVAEHYLKILNAFISVVAANKVANSSDYAHYKLLKETAKTKGVKFQYETNVGAGLPVISTINDLMNSGDKILRIEAVLSGTLNFVFNTLSSDIPLSRTVELAKEKGYSEPDPRIDLSGTDVIRKILILARESGYTLEKKDVEVNTFLPADCFEGTVDNFWKKIKTFDDDFEKRRKKLEEQGKRWRFVAIMDNGKASVQLVEVDAKHPAYFLEGSNNIIILTTERYKELPMVIKGYGAGAGVTAAGVFADILRIANI